MRKTLAELPKEELVELIRTVKSLNTYNLADVKLAGVNLQAPAESRFSEYGRIEVNVDNLDLSRDGDLVVSTFDQDLVAWRSDPDAPPDYVDRGRKTLVMAQDDSSDWRGVSEKWRPIQCVRHDGFQPCLSCRRTIVRLHYEP
ncbi:MAG: hypothetical protein ABGY41_15790 [Candidatus Poribacteria bacterium]